MNAQHATHTPGPWIARGESVMAHRPHAVGGYNEESVSALTRSPEERLANARLIAAAPELLNALRELVNVADDARASWLHDCDEGSQVPEDLTRLEHAARFARAALAKAGAL